MDSVITVHVLPQPASIEPETETAAVTWHALDDSAESEVSVGVATQSEAETLDLAIRNHRVQPTLAGTPRDLQRHIATFLRNEDLSSLALQSRALHHLINSTPKRKALIARGRQRQKDAVLVRQRERQLHRYFTRLQHVTSLLVHANIAMPLLLVAVGFVTPFTCGLALDGNFSLSIGLLPLTIYLAFFLLVLALNVSAALCREKAPLSNYDLDRLAYALFLHASADRFCLITGMQCTSR